MKDIALFALVQVGLLFVYGIRGAVGRWIVTTTFKIAKRYAIRTERDLALYLHLKNQAIAKKLK